MKQDGEFEYMEPVEGEDYEKTVTLCQVCHDFKLCFDFGEDWSERLPSVLCEECMYDFNLFRNLAPTEQREVLNDLLLKSGYNMKGMLALSQEIATYPTERLKSTMVETLQNLLKISKEFPFPFKVNNKGYVIAPKPGIRSTVRKKQADMAITIFLLKEEIRSRTEASDA